MKFVRVAVAGIGLLTVGQSVSAGSVVGVIKTLHVNLETGLAHVQFVDKPMMDGGQSGSCSHQWTGNLLSDEQFMLYVWPLLVSAKTHEKPVRIMTNGCNGQWPKIAWVDVEPRVE